MPRVAAVLLAILVLAPLALGADVRGPVVARDGTVELHARMDGKKLCLTVDDIEDRCERPPRSAFAYLGRRAVAEEDAFAIAVPPAVTSVGLERTDGEQRYDTVTAEGFASRFLLVAQPGRVRLARYYAADGTLLGASEGGALDRERDGTVVLTGGGERVRVYTADDLAPLPGAPDRVVRRACVSARTGSGGQDFCANGLYGDGSVLFADQPACAPQRDLLYGIAEPQVKRVRLTFGDGRRRFVRTESLPAAFAGQRALAYPVPRGQAIRRVDTLQRPGGYLVVGQAPSGLPCRQAAGGSFPFPIPVPPETGPPATVAEASGHRLLAADSDDDDEDVCVAFDALRRSRERCDTAPYDTQYGTFVQRGRAYGGVVAAGVATVELRLDRGEPVRADTVAGEAYTGRFAGKVRFAALAVPAGRKIVRVVLRGPDGAILGSTAASFRETVTGRRVLARKRGVGLRAARYTNAFAGLDHRLCVDPFGAPGGSGSCLLGRRSTEAGVVVGCAPAQAMVFGRIPDGVDGVTVHLAGGATQAARIVALQPRRAFVAFLPPGAGLRSVTAGAKRFPAHFPPAARQCGYGASLTAES